VVVTINAINAPSQKIVDIIGITSVKPAWRRRLSRAASQGHARLVLSVSPDNGRAADFYRKQGFSFLPEWEALASHPDLNAQKMEFRVLL
jgi:predicted dehydrogenase